MDRTWRRAELVGSAWRQESRPAGRRGVHNLGSETGCMHGRRRVCCRGGPWPCLRRGASPPSVWWSCDGDGVCLVCAVRAFFGTGAACDDPRPHRGTCLCVGGGGALSLRRLGARAVERREEGERELYSCRCPCACWPSSLRCSRLRVPRTWRAARREISALEGCASPSCKVQCHGAGALLSTRHAWSPTGAAPGSGKAILQAKDPTPSNRRQCNSLGTAVVRCVQPGDAQKGQWRVCAPPAHRGHRCVLRQLATGSPRCAIVCHVTHANA